jgi:hypothetical protein
LASEAGLKLLGDTLGIELEREAEEHPVGPFRADILAKRMDTPEDHWVLIENQLERTDHGHLGQLLTYAAGLKAATIVWVAESFTDEHRAALDWLNEITSEQFEFYGLEVELWRIGTSAPAPKLNLVVRPNDWTRVVKETAARESGVSPLKAQQRRYWEGLQTLLLQRRSVVRPQKPHPQHWATYRVGRSGTWLGASVNTRDKQIAVELAMRGPPGKVWFDELEAQKAAIEAQLGPDLSWERLPLKKQSRIAIYQPNADPTDEAQWPAQHAWLAEKLEAFHRVFSPLVRALSDHTGAGDEEELNTAADEGQEGAGPA